MCEFEKSYALVVGYDTMAMFQKMNYLVGLSIVEIG